MPEYIIIHGPARSGKTLNKKALQEHYKCDFVYDAGFDDLQIKRAMGRVLILSQSPDVKDVHDRRRLIKPIATISITEAEKALGSKWVKPSGQSVPFEPLPCRLSRLYKELKEAEQKYRGEGKDEAECAMYAAAERLKEVVDRFFDDVKKANQLQSAS